MKLPKTFLNRMVAFLTVGLVTVSVLSAMQATKGPVARFTATTANINNAGDNIRIDILNWSTDAERDQMVAAWSLTAPLAVGGRGGPGGPGGGPGGGAGRGGTPRGGGAPGTPPAPGPPGAAAPDGAAAGAPAGGAPAGRGGRGGGAAAGGAGGGAPRGGGGPRGGGAGPGDATANAPAAALLTAVTNAKTVGAIWTSESLGYSLRMAYRIPQTDGSTRAILLTDRRLGGWNDTWKVTPAAAPTDYEFTLLELRLPAKGDGEARASLTGKIKVDSDTHTLVLENYAELPVVLKGVKLQSGN